MDKRLVKAWVADLRSGKFPQCAETLHRVKGTGRMRAERAGYCCLGVLSERIAKHKAVRETGWKWNGQAWELGVLFEEDRLPADVCEAIGLSDVEASGLMSANDERRKTFPQIADMIERMFLK